MAVPATKSGHTRMVPPGWHIHTFESELSQGLAWIALGCEICWESRVLVWVLTLQYRDEITKPYMDSGHHTISKNTVKKMNLYM